MGAPYLQVARFSKPHGLKGEAVVYVLTDAPEEVFVLGRVLTPLDDDGQPVGPGLTIERSRPYQRRWLLKFEELSDRPAVDRWRDVALGAPQDQLAAPGEGEMYLHELPGATVKLEGRSIGTVREVLDAPSGRLLVVVLGDREVLVPFREPIVVGVDRERREIEIDPPPGLLEL
jgi:16S rRNA processing protein RimM